jgi:hypothetical protein
MSKEIGAGHPAMIRIASSKPNQEWWTSNPWSAHSNNLGNQIACQAIIVEHSIVSEKPTSLDIRCPVSPPNILNDRIPSAPPLFLRIRSSQPTQHPWTSDVLSAHPTFLMIGSRQPLHYCWGSDRLSRPNNLGHPMSCQPTQHS